MRVVSKGTKITPRQKELLNQFGILPPPTKSSASDLIGFVLKGNGTGGKTQSDRIGLVKHAQTKWIGKKVTLMGRESQTGTVLYIRAKDSSKVYDQKIFNIDSNIKREVHPFVAHIKWEDGHTSQYSLGGIVEATE